MVQKSALKCAANFWTGGKTEKIPRLAHRFGRRIATGMLFNESKTSLPTLPRWAIALESRGHGTDRGVA